MLKSECEGPDRAAFRHAVLTLALTLVRLTFSITGGENVTAEFPSACMPLLGDAQGLDALDVGPDRLGCIP